MPLTGEQAGFTVVSVYVGLASGQADLGDRMKISAALLVISICLLGWYVHATADDAAPDLDLSIEDLREKLQTGTPEEKEQTLDSFMKQFLVELVPDIIAAILDDTRLPRRGDTGWGTVHHYAATAMCAFAQRIDGLSQKERDRHVYSFYDEGGVATTERRQEVHANWLAWWEEHEQAPEAGPR